MLQVQNKKQRLKKRTNLICERENFHMCHVTNSEQDFLPFSIAGIRYAAVDEKSVSKSYCEPKPTDKNKSYTIKVDLRIFLSPLVFTRGRYISESEKFQES